MISGGSAFSFFSFFFLSFFESFEPFLELLLDPLLFITGEKR